MKKCIFCNCTKNDSEFNDEHIVLKALGGFGEKNMYHHVCKKCNSSFGASIDSLASDTLIIFRYLLKIRGRNSVPNPFPRECFYPLELSEGQGKITNVKGRLITNQNGDIVRFQAIPKAYDSLVVSEKQYFHGFVKHFLKRTGQKTFQDDNNLKSKLIIKKYPYIILPSLTTEQLDYMCLSCIPLAIKMAFEFFCKISDVYQKDELFEPIKDFIINFNVKEVITIPTNVYSRALYDTMSKEDWAEWKALPNHDIRISLESDIDKNKVIAKIDLYHFFTFEIIMSENASQYNNLNESLCISIQ